MQITSSFARFARSATSTYVSNPVLDSSLCRAAAPPLCPLHVQLLLPHCVRFMFSCCSCSAAAPPLCPLHVQLLLPHCVRFMFSCCSPTVSASCSAAAPPLCPLHVQLLLPHCVRFMFSCCSPIASASAASRCLRPLQNSTAAPRLRPLRFLLPDPRSALTAARALSDCMHLLVASAGFQPMPGPITVSSPIECLRRLTVH